MDPAALSLTAQAEQLLLDYGAGREPAAIGPLQELYTLLVERLPTSERLALLERVFTVASRQDGWEGAFFPFIMAEPEHVVIARASLHLATLTRPEDDDPLTGPRRLRALAEQDLGQPARAGLLGGLVLLGDRRFLPLLRGSWDLLDAAGRSRLARAPGEPLYAATVDFLLDWLESADEASFRLVAGALARLPNESSRPVVIDIELELPFRAGDDGPNLRLLGQWSLAEYGRQIEPRLRALQTQARQEAAVRSVLTAWSLINEPGPAARPLDDFQMILDRLSNRGQDDGQPSGLPSNLEALAATLQASIDRGDPTAPLPLPPTPHSTEYRLLLSWGWPPPPGPLVGQIEGLRVATTGQWLLVYAVERPMFTYRAAFGVLDGSPWQAGGPIVDRLRRFFSTNGAPGCWLLTASLPTYVRLQPDGPVDQPTAAALFELALRAMIESGEAAVEPEPGARQTRLGSPLEQARRAVSWILRQRGGPPDSTNPAEPDQDVPIPIWLSLACHPDWVARAEAEVRAAWSGRTPPPAD